MEVKQNIRDLHHRNEENFYSYNDVIIEEESQFQNLLDFYEDCIKGRFDRCENFDGNVRSICGQGRVSGLNFISLAHLDHDESKESICGMSTKHFGPIP